MPAKKVSLLSLIVGLALVGVFALRSSTTASVTPAKGAGAVGELDVKIKEWSIPSKGGHPHDPAVGRMARFGSPNRW